MLQTITLLEMPLKDDKDSENIVVKNEDIHENDVLMGRGGKNNRHIGNEKLRDIARGQVEKYKVSTKKIKSAISRDIVKQVRTLDPPGRFLKRVAETGEWEDVGDYLAREKVAQVLRDAVCEAAEAMRPSIHPAMYAAAAPYLPYPDGRAAAGVFRQNPPSGMGPVGLGDEARRSAIPGVVTASGSSSFGQPPGYPMPPPWHHPYHGPQSPPQPPPNYPGVPHHQPPPPFPPGYPPTPHHPAHPFPAAAAAAAASPQVAYAVPPRRTPQPGEPSASPVRPVARPATAPPLTSSRSTGTPSAFSPPYRPPPLAAAPGAMPPPPWQHPAEAYATPPLRGRLKKRARSLPVESSDNTPPSADEPSPATESSKSQPESGSSGESKPPPTKRTSATQTPAFFASPGPRSGTVGGVATQTHPQSLWEQSTQPMMPYPSAPAGHHYYEQQQHSQHPFEQSTYHPHPPTPLPGQPQPPTRSFSAPLPHSLGGAPAPGATPIAPGAPSAGVAAGVATAAAAAAGAGGESKESGSSSPTMVERSRHATLSSRKVSRRIPRPNAPTGDFEAIAPEQPGGSGTMEPLPVQQGESSAEHHQQEPLPPAPVAAALPSNNSTRARASNRRGSRTPNPSGGATEAESGLDWFQGQLLLESDEEEDSEEEEEIKDAYPV